MQTLQTEHHSDPATNRMQERLRTIINVLAGLPILDGVLLENVTLTTADTPVAHGLGRVPRGCFMVKGNTSVAWSATTPADDKFVYLLCASGTKTVSLWVF